MSTANVMTAAVLDAHDASFRVGPVARPEPGAGQVLVRILASGVNPLDTKIHAGQAAHARHPLAGDTWDRPSGHCRGGRSLVSADSEGATKFMA